MNVTSTDIINFIVVKTGCSENEITPLSDLHNDLGCTGDDFDELINEFEKQFNVDMNSYLWYFHTDEEGQFYSIGRLFFKAPYEKVKHIAVTPTVLLDSANAGKWIINYPDHLLSKRRYDIMVNQLMAIVFILFLIYKCTK